MASPTGNGDYELLKARLRTLLPETYQDSYESVRPVSMGSASLKFGADGRVAWDEIWGSFCHLAMAGGPPHRGTLLEPSTRTEINTDRGLYREVVSELCRGVQMVTGLAAMPSRFSGWIDVDCPSTGMAGWLVRAINMENVSAHAEGMVLRLPAGPRFRLEKEIKNVVVSIAKTCHYWVGHTSAAQHRAIAELFRVMESESPLIQAPFPVRHASAASEKVRDTIAGEIQSRTGLKACGREYLGWLGVDYLHDHAAVWMMHVVVASNVLCRRENNSIYIPVNPSIDRLGDRVIATVERAHRFACVQKVM